MRLSELAVDVMPLTRAFRLKSLKHDAALAAFREVQRSALPDCTWTCACPSSRQIPIHKSRVHDRAVTVPFTDTTQHGPANGKQTESGDDAT